MGPGRRSSDAESRMLLDFGDDFIFLFLYIFEAHRAVSIAESKNPIYVDYQANMLGHRQWALEMVTATEFSRVVRGGGGQRAREEPHYPQGPGPGHG